MDEERGKAVARFLQQGEEILENTSARMQPDPEDRGVGYLYLTDRRLVWHLPDAVANPTGGVPVYIFREGAFADDILVLKMDVASGLDVLWFQLYPGPISASLVDRLFRLIGQSRASHGKNQFIRSTDPDELLMR
jgi:hypothetical protein